MTLTILKRSTHALAFVLLTCAVSAADFDHDGRADFAVFRPADSMWHVSCSASAGAPVQARWGNPGDVLVPGDYDGDRKTDLAVWRPANGVWYIQQSSDGGVVFIRWGKSIAHPTGDLADVPVPADYDGDGRTDIAVWRHDTGEWWILASSTDYDQRDPLVVRWGRLGDVPVQGDYDGDRRSDQSVFRTTENRWYILESTTNQMRIEVFGLAGSDKLVPADYDGDKKTDIAVYRDGTWYAKSSRSGEIEISQFGFSDARPVPADYDGDGSADLAVYRGGTWYVSDSGKPRLRAFNFGLVTDIPITAGVVRESIVEVP